MVTYWILQFSLRLSRVEYTVSKLRPLTDVLGYVVFEEKGNEEPYLLRTQF